MNPEDRELLIRIDERTKITKTKVEGMEKTMREGYITKEEFDPIKKIVYGLVGLILLGAGGILVDLIFASKQVVP